MTWMNAGIRRLASRGALLLSVGALVALAGCGTTAAATSSDSTSAPTATTAPAPTSTTSTIPANATTIKITGAAGSFAFEPSSVTVKVGSTVVWVNNSGAPHTSTSDSGAAISWDSSTINSGGGSFSFVFTKPGTYHYHCAFHPFMHGTIIVTG